MVRILSNYRNVEPKMYHVGHFCSPFRYFDKFKSVRILSNYQNECIYGHMTVASFTWILSKFIIGLVYCKIMRTGITTRNGPSMLEMKCVGDNYKMLVTVLAIWIAGYQQSKDYQHHVVTNITVTACSSTGMCFHKHKQLCNLQLYCDISQSMFPPKLFCVDDSRLIS